MEIINKYKHYLIIISALLLVKILIEPLLQNLQSLKEEVNMSERQVVKIERLIEKQEHLIQRQTEIDKSLLDIQPYLFNIQDDATFKLNAQSLIEKALNEANCNIEQIGWEGKSNVSSDLFRWQLKARYKGGPECLLKGSRYLEALKPLVRIKNYFYGGKQIQESPNSIVTAQLDLIMWQSVLGAE